MSAEIRYISKPHPVTGVVNSKLGMWCFLASEIMLFGALFSSFILLRAGSPSWPHGHDLLNIPLATANTMILIASSITMVMAWAELAGKNLGAFKKYLAATILLGISFLVLKGYEYGMKFEHHVFPNKNNFYGIYFTITGLHILHLVGGIAVNLYFLFPGSKLYDKDPEQFLGRIEAAGLYWHFVDLVWLFVFPTLYLL